MITCDVLVVGGGPAGSTCARMLRQAGRQVVVLDRATFPRDKVCAGWLTPAVFPLLGLEPRDYAATGLTLQPIEGFRTGLIGGEPIDTAYGRVVSYAIRRVEFDDFLLRRAGAPVMQASVASMRRSAGRWIVNDSFAAPLLVGAGGHFCPVARFLRGEAEDTSPVVAKEVEFLVGDHRMLPTAPELFFCRDLEGYGWCVRKGEYLNVGLGRRDSDRFNDHMRDFVAFLERTGRLPRDARPHWRGHAYRAAGTGRQPLIGDGMLVVGDAAGLAYPESGEGIKPAIESAVVAARTIVAAGDRGDAAALQSYADELRRLYPPAPRSSPPVRSAKAAAARVLLKSRLFTRHVLLDRWFLRRTA